MPREFSPEGGAEVKFPNYTDVDAKEIWGFFGGRPRGFWGGANGGGAIKALNRSCSGISSACCRSR
jgi:hypothetical protein